MTRLPITLCARVSADEKGPWGPWATAALTVLIATVFSVAQFVVAIPYLVVTVAASPKVDIQAAANSLQTDSLFFALAELVAGSFALGITFLVVWLRKGPPLSEYLALRPVTRLTILLWLLYTLLLGILLDGISYAAGYAVVPEWMLAMYRSARLVPVTLLALLVMAPLLEEIVFRGFFLEGVRHSRLGNTGAVLLASLLWASVHVQYEWFYIGQIFILGLLLGAARLWTRSLLPPILMHALFSGVATLQVAMHSSK